MSSHTVNSSHMSKAQSPSWNPAPLNLKAYTWFTQPSFSLNETQARGLCINQSAFSDLPQTALNQFLICMLSDFKAHLVLWTWYLVLLLWICPFLPPAGMFQNHFLTMLLATVLEKSSQQPTQLCNFISQGKPLEGESLSRNRSQALSHLWLANTYHSLWHNK